MKAKSIFKLFVASALFLSACKSSHVQSTASSDRFLFVIVKNEPGVISGLLSSCSCLQIIRMETVDVEPVLVDFTGSRTLPLSTLRLLIRIKQEGNITHVKDQLSEMQDVISVNFIR